VNSGVFLACELRDGVRRSGRPLPTRAWAARPSPHTLLDDAPLLAHVAPAAAGTVSCRGRWRDRSPAGDRPNGDRSVCWGWGCFHAVDGCTDHVSSITPRSSAWRAAPHILGGRDRSSSTRTAAPGEETLHEMSADEAGTTCDQRLHVAPSRATLCSRTPLVASPDAVAPPVPWSGEQPLAARVLGSCPSRSSRPELLVDGRKLRGRGSPRPRRAPAPASGFRRSVPRRVIVARVRTLMLVTPLGAGRFNFGGGSSRACESPRGRHSSRCPS
jgi:hypothetical protein